jgi:predicted hydrocarbon binding protein
MNLLGEMVEETWGIAEWNDLLKSTGLDGVYTSAATYADDEAVQLITEICNRRDMEQGDLLREFGKYMFPRFHDLYSELIDHYDGLIPFLLTIHDTIHVEVKKLYPDAQVPSFEYERPSADSLTMFYRSERRMCRLAEGLIIGAADHFNTDHELIHDTCMHTGSDHCALKITVGAPPL